MSADFKDLVAWQKSHILTIDIYSAFSHCRDFGFRDQIQRASISIMNNIAEGAARRSHKSFKQFLLIAKGSAAEVESMLIVSYSLKYLNAESFEDLLNKTEEVSRLLGGFIRKLQTHDS